MIRRKKPKKPKKEEEEYRSVKSKAEKMLERRAKQKKRNQRRTTGVREEEKQAMDRIRNLKEKNMKKKTQKAESTSKKKIKEDTSAEGITPVLNADSITECLLDVSAATAEELIKAKESGQNVRWKKRSYEVTKDFLEQMGEILVREKSPEEREKILENVKERLDLIEQSASGEASKKTDSVREMNQQQKEAFLKGVRDGIEQGKSAIDEKIEKVNEEPTHRVIEQEQQEPLSKQEKRRRQDERKLERALDDAKDLNDYNRLRNVVEKRETSLTEGEIQSMKQELGEEALIDIYTSAELTKEEKQKLKENSDYLQKYY